MMELMTTAQWGKASTLVRRNIAWRKLLVVFADERSWRMQSYNICQCSVIISQLSGTVFLKSFAILYVTRHLYQPIELYTIHLALSAAQLRLPTIIPASVSVCVNLYNVGSLVIHLTWLNLAWCTIIVSLKWRYLESVEWFASTWY